MSEIDVVIPAGSASLEACCSKGEDSASEVAILCHPHPLYGGDMDNNVILALRNVLAAWGWGTIRFNFRGVGRSSGKYGDGEGEVQDVLAVASYAKEKGWKCLHIAGYSFGAWIALKAMARGLETASGILISPPLDFLDFGSLSLPREPCLITLGDQDSFCSIQSLRRWLSAQETDEDKVSFQTIPGCDHFYWSQEELLAAKVSGFLKKHFQPPA